MNDAKEFFKLKPGDKKENVGISIGDYTIRYIPTEATNTATVVFNSKNKD